MRFLFINPNRRIVKNNIWGVINSITPPLGLATLSAVLDARGHDSDIIDAYAENMTIPDILSRVPADVDVIGLTATTPEIEDAVDIARSLRRHFPGKKIIMGGVHPTVFHEDLIAEGICDMVIRGEGEKTILCIANQMPLKDIPNLTWKAEDEETVVNPQEDEFVQLDELPMPSYHKLPMQKYRSAIGAARRSPSIGMMTSRGCPGKCTFCFSGMFGKNIRFLSAENVYEQILHLKLRYGIREISFYDDTFTANLKRVEQLCRLLISSRADITWSCFARVDTVNPDILKMMKAAGCHQIMYGFETIDENILKAVNKRVKTTQYADVVAWTRAAGIDIRAAFMLGSPAETIGSMKATIEYARQIDIQYAIFNITTPYPGTTLFREAVEKGCLRHTRWAEYDLSHAILNLPGISPEAVEAHYREAYRAFYFRWSYLVAHLLSIKTLDSLMIHFEAAGGILKNILKSA
jgi:anaerobic magnesium-protoporphyrin IX monomethyl ester cyclase